MANDTTAFMQPEDWKIDMADAWQVLWWCRYLRLTKSQLEIAVQAVGTVVVDVKRYLACQPSFDTTMPPVKPVAGASHITIRSALSRSPF